MARGRIGSPGISWHRNGLIEHNKYKGADEQVNANATLGENRHRVCFNLMMNSKDYFPTNNAFPLDLNLFTGRIFTRVCEYQDAYSVMKNLPTCSLTRLSITRSGVEGAQQRGLSPNHANGN